VPGIKAPSPSDLNPYIGVCPGPQESAEPSTAPYEKHMI
jgi:hypothetical protein